ncbi:testis-expressed protein 11 isoform X1 [Brienomyrus brachyistius]|uniref:testis-expressed protein 11 isoform X1 n=1 Tax=Brienomyrus brachyistius TaxID=42636 RepID=UPI0020B3CBD0|nr:testis-expressed protein 11 isoform X1 [Brienomyrus brachyistius]
METLFAQIRVFTEKLLENQINVNIEEIIENLLREVSSLEPPTAAKSWDPEVEETAVQLWNWAVTKHVGSAISLEHKAKVRHVACRLLYVCESDSPSESTLRRQILMATKTGRTWLDCKNPTMADEFLNLAVKSLELLYSKLMSRGERRMDINIPKGDIEKDLFRVLTYQAESALMQDNHQVGVSQVSRCKDMLERLPKETGYLCLLCYNFGINNYTLKKYRESTFWLSQSHEIGKMNEFGPGASVRAKVLRLLATVFLEWDCQEYQEKALSAVTLANKESVHPSGLFLKMRILLTCKAQDEHVRAAIMELLGPEIPLDVCLSAVRLLMTENRESLAFEFLQQVCQCFESSSELGVALVLHVELLLQRGREAQGKQQVERIMAEHHAGKPLSPQTLCLLHSLLWDRAARHFEAHNYTEALQWYSYSLSFYPAGAIDQNLAKLQRNRASCFLQLKQLEKAKDAVNEAERCDPCNIFTQFSIYKVALLEKDMLQATEAVRQMAKLSKEPISCEERLLMGPRAASDLLAAAAHMALENGQPDTAATALRSLCQSSADSAQVLRALQCLVRLVLSATENESEEMSDADLDAVQSYLAMALQKVSQLPSDLGSDPAKRAEEASWFRKIAWNLALQCVTIPDRMRDFFVLSYQLSQFCPPKKAVLMGQKTCLLMAAAACLELYRMSAQSAPQTEQLTQALEHIQSCREIWKTLKATGDFLRDPTDTLLFLYEFEARAKLSDPKLEAVLEAILEMDPVEIKTLETVAALAMESPAHFPQVSKRALKMALSLHRKQPREDLSRCSRWVCSLIELSLPGGVSEVEPRILEEVWGYFEEARSIIASASEELPELEVLWLLTRAWNTGILLFSLAQFPEAERWCGLGMAFLCHLHSLQESYRIKMSSLYAEVLDRLDKVNRNVVMEE